MAKDDIKVPMEKTSGTQAYSPNTAPGIKSKHGANFQFCEPDGNNKDTAPEGKKGGM